MGPWVERNQGPEQFEGRASDRLLRSQDEGADAGVVAVDVVVVMMPVTVMAMVVIVASFERLGGEPLAQLPGRSASS